MKNKKFSQSPLKFAYNLKNETQKKFFKDAWIKVFDMSERNFFKHINQMSLETVALFEYVFNEKIKVSEYIAETQEFERKGIKPFEFTKEEVETAFDNYLK